MADQESSQNKVPGYLPKGTNIYSFAPFEPHLSEIADRNDKNIHVVRELVYPTFRTTRLFTKSESVYRVIDTPSKELLPSQDAIRRSIMSLKQMRVSEMKEVYELASEIHQALLPYPRLGDYLKALIDGQEIVLGGDSRKTNNEPILSYPGWLDSQRFLTSDWRDTIYKVVAEQAFMHSGSEGSPIPTHAQTRARPKGIWYRLRQAEVTKREQH